MSLARLFCHAALLLVLALSATAQASESGVAQATTGRVAKPIIEPARGDKCVEPAQDMRRNHMEYLKHQRDDTMRGGIRGAKYSLKTCIECHASQTTNSVTAAPTNFCISCHSFAAVKVDCFECHATQPASKSVSFMPLGHPTQAHGVLSNLRRQFQNLAPLKP